MRVRYEGKKNTPISGNMAAQVHTRDIKIAATYSCQLNMRRDIRTHTF